MFRHVVMFAWTEEADEAAKADALRRLERLASLVPTVRNLSFGEDAGLAADNHDLAVVVDFEDVEGYLAYASHPAHVELVTEHLRPLIRSRAAVQYPLPEGD